MVEHRFRRIEWQKVTLSFLVACFLFTLGVFLGYLAKGIVSNATINLQDTIRNEILVLETINLMEQQNPCDTYNLDLISEKLDYLGELITLLEVKKGKDDWEVLELKKLYSVLEVRHFILVKQLNIHCEYNYSIFFFFYSNEEECDDEVEKTSFILSFLRKKYDFVRVYSFDTNLDSDIIKVLKNKYNIEDCSSVILNDEKIEKRIKNAKDLEILLPINSSIN